MTEKRSNDQKSKKGSKEQKSAKIYQLNEYTMKNKEDLITYILLAIGIIVLFFNPLIGGLILGIIVGYYFSAKIIDIISHGKKLYNSPKIETVVLAVALLGLLIVIPSFILGTLVIAAAKEGWGKGRR